MLSYTNFERIGRWLLIKGSIAFAVFVLSVLVAAVVPGFLLQKLLVFGFGWAGGLTARYIQRGGNRE